MIEDVFLFLSHHQNIRIRLWTNQVMSLFLFPSLSEADDNRVMNPHNIIKHELILWPKSGEKYQFL